MICQTLADPPIKKGFWILTSIIFKGPQAEIDKIQFSWKINYCPTFKVSNYYEKYYEHFDFMKHFNHGKSVNANEALWNIEDYD